MEVHGTYDSAHSREEVYQFLTDPRRLASALPHASPTDVTDTGFVAHASVGVGPLGGSIDVHMQLVSHEDGKAAAYKGEGHGMGSKFGWGASFQLSDRQGQSGTHVEWTGDAELEGPLGGLADHVAEQMVRQNVEDIMHSMDRTLSGSQRPQ